MKAQWDKEALDFNFKEQVKWDEDQRAPELKGPKPTATPPAPSNVAMVAPIYAALMREHAVKHAQWSEKARAYKAAYKWIQETVDPSIYQSAVRECEIEEEQRAKEQPDRMTDEPNDPRSWTLQMLLKVLKRDYAPSETSNLTKAQAKYREKLEVVKTRRVNLKV